MPSDKLKNRDQKNESLNKVFRGLAAKNVKKSAKDYFIYFFTLIMFRSLRFSPSVAYIPISFFRRLSRKRLA